jgi:hypothetical protein
MDSAWPRLQVVRCRNCTQLIPASISDEAMAQVLSPVEETCPHCGETRNYWPDQYFDVSPFSPGPST